MIGLQTLLDLYLYFNATYEAMNALMLVEVKKCYHILFAQGEGGLSEV